MELGMIGLGRMGGMMTERLLQGGHALVGFDRQPGGRRSRAGPGRSGRGLDSPRSAGQLTPRRAVWLMVPSGDAVDRTIEDLLPLLNPGDVVIDGGNSNFKDTIRRAAMLKARGFAMVDCGTSGGIWGLADGYSLMIGGEPETVAWLRPIFETLAPAPDRGWGHVGGNGAGHLVKMVHNGIEYGMMQAYAEGFAILRAKEDYHLDLAQIAEIWRHGSVVRSWLLDLLAEAIAENPGDEGDRARGRRFRRGALDRLRGDRQQRPRPGHHAVPDRAHPLARSRLLHRPAPRRDAPRLRRAPDQDGAVR